MGPQGNLLRNESLVLVVTVSDPTPTQTLQWWEARIRHNIQMHLEMRFNKGRFAGRPYVDLLNVDDAAVATASRKREQISRCMEKVRLAVVPHAVPRRLTELLVTDTEQAELKNQACVLLLLRSAASPDPESGKDEHEFIRRVQSISKRPCAVEFFHVEPEPYRDARDPRQENKPSEDVADDLYHLASRVCGAFTEYRIKYARGSRRNRLIKMQQQFFYMSGSSTVTSATPCDPAPPRCEVRHSVRPFDLGVKKVLLARLEKGGPAVKEVECLPKILDIRDAISVVCEGLDGSEHFFPQVPRGMRDIFEGKDNATRVVAARYKFPFGVWFRGQARVCFDTVPSLFHESHWRPIHDGCRKQSCGMTMYDEATMMHHFMAQKPLLRHDYLDHFEWLCLMQHHGAPTRVLDWSENILIALYFAVCDTTADCDGIVWALNAGRLNEITRVSTSYRYVCLANSTDVVLRSAMAVSRTGRELRRTLEKMGRLSEVRHAVNDTDFWKWTRGEDTSRQSPTWRKLAAPVAVFPTRVNPREEDQLATFTICGGKQYDAKVTSIEAHERFPPPLDLVELSRWRQELPEERPGERKADWDPETRTWIPYGKPFLQAFLVPSCAKRKLREQLKRLGVHVGALFPELEHQTRYIRHQWRFEYKNPGGAT